MQCLIPQVLVPRTTHYLQKTAGKRLSDQKGDRPDLSAHPLTSHDGISCMLPKGTDPDCRADRHQALVVGQVPWYPPLRDLAGRAVCRNGPYSSFQYFRDPMRSPCAQSLARTKDATNLFDLAPLVYLKFRRRKLVGRKVTRVTAPALANHAVDSDPDGVDHGLESKPLLAFAVCRERSGSRLTPISQITSRITFPMLGSSL